MEELDIAWSHVIKIWWSLFLRSKLLGAISFIAGLVTVFIFKQIGVEERYISILSGLSGFLIGIPIGIYLLRMILLKQFTGFRIALIKI